MNSHGLGAPAGRRTLPTAPSDASRRRLDEAQDRACQVVARTQAVVRALFAEARLGRRIDVDPARRRVDEVLGSVDAEPGVLLSLVRFKTAHNRLSLHAVAVCALMVTLARQLQLPDALVREAGLGGLLHDIGKARLPATLFGKPPEDLSEEDRAALRAHAELGQALLKQSGVSADALDICQHHHERTDGGGYPRGLRQARISLLAKMAAVCNAYDAATERAAHPGDALQQMLQSSGRFDETVLRALVQAVGVYPVGTLLQLHSGRVGIVIRHNTADILLPRLKLFFCTRTGERIAPKELDLAWVGRTERIVGGPAPLAWPFRSQDQLWTGGTGVARRAAEST